MTPKILRLAPALAVLLLVLGGCEKQNSAVIALKDSYDRLLAERDEKISSLHAEASAAAEDRGRLRAELEAIRSSASAPKPAEVDPEELAKAIVAKLVSMQAVSPVPSASPQSGRAEQTGGGSPKPVALPAPNNQNVSGGGNRESSGDAIRIPVTWKE